MNPRILPLVPAVLLVVACGSSRAKRPAEPAGGPSQAAASAARTVGAAGPTREIALGELCPEAVQGRPAVKPMVLRRAAWSADPRDTERALTRSEARQFSVLGWDGRRVGLFSVVGTTDAGLDQAVGIGSYAGASPCARAAERGAAGSDDPDCVRVQRHCGLAVAALEPAGGFTARPFDEQPDPLATRVGGACVSGGKLVVDVDGDDQPEAFEVADFASESRRPADEITAVTRGDAGCVPRFATSSIAAAGAAGDVRALDVLGVLDLDDDGRHELVLAFDYGDLRTWAVYSARGTAARLELVGAASPWPRR